MKASLEKEQAKKAELEKAEALLKVLETEKVRIESEIKNLKAKGGSADKQNLASLQTELKSVLARVDNEKNLADKIKTDHKKLIGEISDFQTKVLELREVNERLENDNKQLANESKQQADAIAEMKQMIEMEATQRNALDAYIKQLKNDVLGLYVPNEEGEGNEPMGASDVQEKGTVEK